MSIRTSQTLPFETFCLPYKRKIQGIRFLDLLEKNCRPDGDMVCVETDMSRIYFVEDLGLQFVREPTVILYGLAALIGCVYVINVMTCNILYSAQQITSVQIVSQSDELLYTVIIHLSLVGNPGG